MPGSGVSKDATVSNVTAPCRRSCNDGCSLPAPRLWSGDPDRGLREHIRADIWRSASPVLEVLAQGPTDYLAGADPIGLSALLKRLAKFGLESNGQTVGRS